MKNIAEIKDVHKNILGTIDFKMKCKGHRGYQGFSVYPIAKNSESKVIRIQSDKRWGELDIATGNIEIGKSKVGMGNSIGFMMDQGLKKTIIVTLSEYDTKLLKESIFLTASKEAGKKENGIMQCDNSGAINLMDM